MEMSVGLVLEMLKSLRIGLALKLGRKAVDQGPKSSIHKKKWPKGLMSGEEGKKAYNYMASSGLFVVCGLFHEHREVMV